MKSRQIEEAGLCWKCRMKIEIFEVLWDKIALTKFDIDIEILWYNVSEGRRQMETILSVSIEDTMHRTLGNSGGEDVHWLYSTLYSTCWGPKLLFSPETELIFPDSFPVLKPCQASVECNQSVIETTSRVVPCCPALEMKYFEIWQTFILISVTSHEIQFYSIKFLSEI